MFSGIIEAQSKILSTVSLESSLRIELERPPSFDELKTGDSISVNGMCLTLEKFNADQMQLTLGAESLRVLGSVPLINQIVNIERSLRWGDRIHGHWVTGHVDQTVEILTTQPEGECWFLKLELPTALRVFIFEKGSVCLNGVSLTVNQVSKDFFSILLIPETIQRTNLTHMKSGQRINLEADWMAKSIHNILENRKLLEGQL